MLARTKACLAFGILGAWALPASAAYQWQFATGSAFVQPASFCGAAQSFTYGNCFTYGSTPGGGGNVNVNAWASTGTSTGGTNNATSTGILQTAYLDAYSGGLGVTDRQEGTVGTSGTSTLYPSNQSHPTAPAPQHSIDNYAATDAVLLSFTNKINLTGLKLGWPTSTSSCTPVESICDTDITIWAYTGAGTPSLAGQTFGSLGAGWVLVSNYLNVPVGTTQLINNAATVDSLGTYQSNYWLISAFYSSSALSTTNNDVDFVKLQAVYGTIPTKVSEPESLALLLLTLIGGAWVRRSRVS